LLAVIGIVDESVPGVFAPDPILGSAQVSCFVLLPLL
jgi:hypothetical protein